MSTVDEWAHDLAEVWYPTDGRQSSRWNAMQVQGQGGSLRMARHLAALLLSDKVARAMSDSVLAETGELFRDYVMRTAMQAALTKITEDK